MVETWVKVGVCTRIAWVDRIGGVYELRTFPLFKPPSIRRLYTFFTQAWDRVLDIEFLPYSSNLLTDNKV
jgi:hypothetical protein